MKKSIKSVLAKSLAVAMAFSLAGIAPSTSSDAAAKKPTLTKKVSVTVGKKKTVKVTSKAKVKKTTWSLTKKGQKLVSLSKKKAKSVVVKGKKKGTATLTAKIKVGKKNYKKTCKITVKSAAKVTTKPTTNPTAVPTANNGGSATPTPCPWVGQIKTDKGTLTVDENESFNIPLTELNETSFTSTSKRPEGSDEITEGTVFNKDGSVSFTSTKDFNSGVSFYVNPCTSKDQIVDISETHGEGYLGLADATKDMSAYDYIRVLVTSANEINLRTYENEELLAGYFPGANTSETYEGGWIESADEDIWEEEGIHSAGKTVKEKYTKRTVFIPISLLMEKGMNPETLAGIAFCPQSGGVDVTIHRVDFVKVKYDKKVTAIEVTAKKDEILQSKSTTVSAKVTPDDATRQAVKWTSSDPTIATVNFQGTVIATKKTGEVTITATATDGSGVTGSTKIKVVAPSDEPDEVTTHKVNLADANVVGTSNNGAGTEAASQSAAGIEFGAGINMTFVNFSEYLAANNLDLSNYKTLDVTWKVIDAEGNTVTDYADAEGAPTYGKIAYAPDSKLTGFDDGIDINYGGDEAATKAWLGTLTGQTCTLEIAKTNPSELATVAGFNIQLSSLPATMKILITDITLNA